MIQLLYDEADKCKLYTSGRQVVGGENTRYDGSSFSFARMILGLKI